LALGGTGSALAAPRDPPTCPKHLAAAAERLMLGDPLGGTLALGACPDLPEAGLVAGVAAVAASRRRLASAALDRAETDPELTAASNHIAGVWALLVGDTTSARRSFGRALASDPAFAPSRVGRILLAARAGDQRQALAEARELAARPGGLRCPQDLDLRDQYGIVASALERATRRHAPDCVSCWRVIADLHGTRAATRRGKAAQTLWGRAEEALGRALRLAPGAWRARMALGRVLGAQGRHGAAAEVYRAGRRIEPDRREWGSLLGAALLQAHRPAEALPLLEEAARHDVPSVWYLVGRARHALGRPDAIEAFERAVAAAGDRATAADLTALGQEYLAAGDATRARALLERAVALDPQDRTSHYALASALRVLGDADRAAEVLARFESMLDAFQKRLAEDEEARHVEAATAEALRLLSEGDPAAARARLAPWKDAAGKPMLLLALAGVAASRKKGAAPSLREVVAAVVAANEWVP